MSTQPAMVCVIASSHDSPAPRGAAVNRHEKPRGAAKKMNIRELRTAANLTQADLAARIGVASITVSRWERGETEPSQSHVAAAAEACGFFLTTIKKKEEK